ncbi:MAG: flavodoxin domain-containing protein [Acidimicrobiia bacterium]
MRLLVAYASKRGGTTGLAEAVAHTLEARGARVDLMPAGEVRFVMGYQGVILGSALYAGRWRPASVRFLRRHGPAMREMPVWLFHSGPLGEEAAESQPLPKNVDRLLRGLEVVDQATFGGRLTVDGGWIARRMVDGGYGGDFRDFRAAERWAADIAEYLGLGAPVR